MEGKSCQSSVLYILCVCVLFPSPCSSVFVCVCKAGCEDECPVAAALFCSVWQSWAEPASVLAPLSASESSSSSSAEPAPSAAAGLLQKVVPQTFRGVPATLVGCVMAAPRPWLYKHIQNTNALLLRCTADWIKIHVGRYSPPYIILLSGAYNNVIK